MTLDFLRSWFDGARLYPFEKLILDEVMRHLSQESGRLLHRQLGTINKVQRLSAGKEVNLYHMRQGKAAFDDNLRFPDAADEALLATIYLTRSNDGSKLKAEVWLANGRLFSLVFNKPPKQFFEGTNLRLAAPQIANVKTWFDPLCPRPSSVRKSIDIPALPGWLYERAKKGRDVELHSPMPESERSVVLDRINAQLPLDYLDLIAHCDGVSFLNFKIYGLAAIREITLPEASYYVFTEIGGLGDLAIEEGSENSEIHLLHYENNDAVSLGTSSLQVAMTKVLESRTD